jgi:putative SOS response-associated peptidase YedK
MGAQSSSDALLPTAYCGRRVAHRPEKHRLRRLFERKDRNWFCFAGIWSMFVDTDEGPIDTFTMLTMDSAEHLAEYHDRRPIALPRDAWQGYLVGAEPAVMPASEIEVSYSSGPKP